MRKNLSIILTLLVAFLCTASVSAQQAYSLRLLNHWDNPNGTIERGFAGHSIFWIPGGQANIEKVKEYGRINQQLGINGAVLNNVNAKPLMLSKAKLKETKRIADALRPYGIKVYLSVNFASPKALGGLKTADPLDKKVQQWWAKKAKEIYSLIPDFGGFLVKANSEGEPGPMDYGRNHADGANMLADALTKGWRNAGLEGKTAQPIVMWRAFVYSPKAGDRASQAYDEFMPFDGLFRDNVIIQIKLGPVDFQPREPVNPLLLAMKKTKMMIEVQLTQEYTGESIHTCFMPFDDPMISLLRHPSENIVGIAGVSNVGDMKNWCGSEMTKANWYAFGKLAGNLSLSKEEIAREWLAKNFNTTDPRFINPMTRVLLESHEAVVRYMMPLGLHHIFAGEHHYGPEPWYVIKGGRDDWQPWYYHKADAYGLGFNRTYDGKFYDNQPGFGIKIGSGNARLYPDSLYHIYNNVETCPEPLLLWFHHVAWNHRMHNGETMWDALCHTYDQGVREAEAFARIWREMKPYISQTQYEEQLECFDRQAKDAWWWRDACLLYFQQFSKMPFPIDSPAPRHRLDDLMKYKLHMDNYTRADIRKLP